jgi:hypothetical protein
VRITVARDLVEADGTIADAKVRAAVAAALEALADAARRKAVEEPRLIRD